MIGQRPTKSNNAPIITLLAVNNDFGDVPFRTGSAVPFENARRYSGTTVIMPTTRPICRNGESPMSMREAPCSRKWFPWPRRSPKGAGGHPPQGHHRGNHRAGGQSAEALGAFSQEDSIYLYRNSCKYAAKWWTRSSNEVYGYGSWTIHPDGRSGSALNVDYDAAVRPAMEMDLSSVLFISAAEHGKVADLTTPDRRIRRR